MDYTVVVAGGGPAGAVTALRLARAGTRVLVVDREQPRRVEAAEIMSPEGRTILENEDLWEHMPLDLTWPCSVMAAAWDGPEPEWTVFTLHASGPAWHVDRARFDLWLRDRLRQEGVDVARGSVERVDRTDDGWQVEVADDAEGSRRAVEARCLVVATGRTSRRVRLAPRRRIDNLCLVTGTTDPDPVEPDALIVEAVADGWWYSAPLLNGRLFSGWMTDFSLVSDGRYEDAARRSLAGAPIHARRVGNPRLDAIIGSATWVTSPAAGPGWIAIGDAALARDPIGGDGLTSALRSACHGADVVLRALGGDDEAWSRAAIELEAIARRYEKQRLDLYRRAARRWPDARFWRRFVDERSGPTRTDRPAVDPIGRPQK